MGRQERKNFARWDEFSGVNTSNQLGEGVKKSVGKLDPSGEMFLYCSKTTELG